MCKASENLMNYYQATELLDWLLTLEFQKESPCPTLISSKSSCGVAEVKQNVLRAAQAHAAQPQQRERTRHPDLWISNYWLCNCSAKESYWANNIPRCGMQDQPVIQKPRATFVQVQPTSESSSFLVPLCAVSRAWQQLQSNNITELHLATFPFLAVIPQSWCSQWQFCLWGH